MKSKIVTLTIATLFIVSCGTKKNATASVFPTTPAVTETVKSAELSVELAAGKNLYENNCVKCHKLFDPKDFTKEDWKPILTKMQPKAHLNDAQMASISNYITSQL